MMPLVTVGLCVKDCEASIRETVESVLSQDYPKEKIELIIVNDGSKDRTISILKDYISNTNRRAKLFSGSWKGLGAARNRVVTNSSGDYIIWVDGDITLPENHIREQVEYMEQNPKVGIAKARYGFTPKENLVAFLENIIDIAKDAIMEDEWQTDLKLPGTGGSIYRTKAIKEVGGFDENLKRVGEDQDAAFRIKEAGWLIHRTQATFYERRSLKTWKTLWNKYFWHGYDHYKLYRKNRSLFIFYKMNPLASFIAGLLYSITAYKITKRTAVFLLPVQYAFKMTAWSLGFMKSQTLSK
jgi:glycosyltransferase involved in cell wall biosynthesis